MVEGLLSFLRDKAYPLAVQQVQDLQVTTTRRRREEDEGGGRRKGILFTAVEV